MNRIIILIFVLFSLHSQAQQLIDYNLKIEYKVSYQPDSTDAKSKKQAFLSLLVGNEGSVSLMTDKLMRDSILAELQKKFGSAYIDLSLTKQFPMTYSFVIAKNTDKIKTIDFGDSKYYLYEEFRTDLKWKIESDTKKIAGFNCQKAALDFGGRQWTAWFTTEIPITDGPYKFCGLPGLIIDIADKQDYFHFTITSLKKQNGSYKMDEYSESIKTTKNEFLKLVDIYRLNKFEIDQTSGRIRFTSGAEEAKKNITAYAQRNNNPIEFYEK